MDEHWSASDQCHFPDWYNREATDSPVASLHLENHCHQWSPAHQNKSVFLEGDNGIASPGLTEITFGRKLTFAPQHRTARYQLIKYVSPTLVLNTSASPLLTPTHCIATWVPSIVETVTRAEVVLVPM